MRTRLEVVGILEENDPIKYGRKCTRDVHGEIN